MSNNIAIIIPYFGEWPEWIELFFYSCGRNSFIDFIFYTNCPMPEHVCKNIKFTHMDFDDYCVLVGTRLGISYHVTSPYKLTDLKPFIGLVHQAELEKYEFWGFGDLDLMYGDLSLIVNKDNLRRYDLITTHNYHIAGHFTLCRNNKHYRNLCLKIDNWSHRLSNNTHYGFDEAEWSDLVYPKMKWVRRIYNYILKPIGIKFNSYMEFANRLATPNQLFSEFYTTPAPKFHDTYTYHVPSGRLCNQQNRELPYLHFLFFKKTPFLDTNEHWKRGFYQVDVDFEKYTCLKFDINKISGVL